MTGISVEQDFSTFMLSCDKEAVVQALTAGQELPPPGSKLLAHIVKSDIKSDTHRMCFPQDVVSFIREKLLSYAENPTMPSADQEQLKKFVSRFSREQIR